MLALRAPRRHEQTVPRDFPAWRLELFVHYHTFPNSRVHDYLDAELPKLNKQRGQRLCILAPRGAAKSTQVTLEYVLHSAIMHAEPYIWIMSDTQPMTRQHLHNIGKEVQGNEKLIKAHTGIVGDAARVTADRIELGNGSVIVGYSTGQNVRGQREGILELPSLKGYRQSSRPDPLQPIEATQKSAPARTASVGSMSLRRIQVCTIAPVLELVEPPASPVAITTIGAPSSSDAPSQSTAPVIVFDMCPL